MNVTETERPASPEQHLWSSILDSVSSSRAIPSKNVIILGEPSAGKSTIANALLQKSSIDKQREISRNEGDKSSRDFALGYEWADVKDEADEDTLARLSVYVVPSSSPAHLSLVPHFLPPKTSLPHSLVMIVLDWTRPWTFVDQLYTWLSWVDKWAKGDGARELEVLREEGRERLQSHLQHYTEPSSTSETVPLPGGNALASTLLPLSQGVFTHNQAGIPIVVVCTKADQIDQEQGAPGLGLSVVKAKGGEWEERTDGIMQVLRTVCLKYGAALFYTSIAQPVSLTQLRAYTLHLLFMPPAPPPDTPPLKYLFPFKQRPNLLDRDRIAVPAGWDTWGKIGVVREGFDCNRWSEAWEKELEDGPSFGGGAEEMYKALVDVEDTDKASTPSPFSSVGDSKYFEQRPPLPPLITTESEQAFLARHYEALAKDPARDPRATFRQPQNPGEQTMAGVVGPLGTSTFNLPTVEKAMIQMEGEDVGAKLARLGSVAGARRDTRTPTAGLGSSSLHPGQPLTNGSRPPLSTSVSFAAAAAASSSPSSPLPGAGSNKSQHEVLQNFFQSLLRDRGSSSSAASNPAPGAGAAASASSANGTGGDEGAGRARAASSASAIQPPVNGSQSEGT